MKCTAVFPKNVPKVTWTVAVTDKERIGWIPVIAKKLVGHVDNSAYPLINVNISMVLVVSREGKGSGAGVDDVWPQRDARPRPADR